MSSLKKELKKDRDVNDNFKNIYKYIYNDCIKAIKYANSTFITETTYQVPMFLLGYPLYDVDKICSKLYNKLKNEGLSVKFLDKNILYIKW